MKNPLGSVDIRGRWRRDLDRVLACAERSIALLDRCRPLNLNQEATALVDAWRAGCPRNPRYAYSSPPDLGHLRRALDEVAARLTASGPLAELYAERAGELADEARLAESVGDRRFAEMAVCRYSADYGADGRLAFERARGWAVEGNRVEASARSRSDDHGDPLSLVSQVRRIVGRLRLPTRVVVHADLAASAAAGDGVIVVKAGVWHHERATLRIALHEVYGHALPRARAARETVGLFAVASARGSDAEEGRALLIESREGLLDIERRAELGRRHLAALSVRDGASFVETVEVVRDVGASVETAIMLASRVHRGGGLARELVYLPQLLRVERALSADPELESWLERGRVSVAAARSLRALGVPPARYDGDRAA